MDTVSNLPDLVQSILNSQSRLQTLAATNLIGTPPETAFDEVSAMASIVMKTPVAKVTFLDANHLWSMGPAGQNANPSPASVSFCSHVLVNKNEPLIVLDTKLDNRFAENPFVKNPPHIRFYVGMPIVVDDSAIGTLCAYDFEPREKVDIQQLRILSDLTNNAAQIVEGRMAA